MAGARFSYLKRLQKYSAKGSFNEELSQPNQRIMNLTRCVDCVRLRFLSTSYSHAYSKRELRLPEIFAENQFRTMTAGNSNLFTTKPAASISPKFSSFFFHKALPFASPSMTLLLNHRSYSSSLSGKGSGDGTTDFPSISGANATNAGGDSIDTSDWADKIKDAWQSAAEAVAYSAQKVKEASDELTPYAQQLLDSHPYLNDVVIPVGGTLIATLIAWIVMPRILRKLHKYATQGPAAKFPGSTSEEQVPYEKSFWGALEDPVRYLVTFMAFSQIGVVVAPTTVASQYLAQAWRGAVILSFVWFLYRCKTNVLARILSGQNLLGLDRDKLLGLDKISSVGLFVIGIMALAEAFGVAVQSIITVGGIGGVATAFAARDILGNVFSGLSMQFSKPFTVGDTIKAGSVEGQVVEMGLTTTSLLNAEKFPVVVPNSLFSSQVIVNKSRAECRAILSKIPLRIEDINKIPKIADDIKSMLRTNAKVFLEKDAPYCYLSHIESSYAQLTIGYNLKYMRKDEMYSAEQDILLQAVQIIKMHGAELGNTWQSVP
ncbi:mechanosensitive ion channel protein 1, mitochondrial [Neltuma alba]|uniref:mechanosensitive ion channel protein 1, mitochondrial n=1 Tax=Neltuma alba TaxID=207710 RepID=UPI0010A5060B|nr:mechanosensitive ion channel protein 1, mitochondrial-like [Prosopis alba]XP_028770397.1 mechanosensitive ion channel protein 1, mitochondrial-like [Prosopis alba]XP_028770398.1 mechanosensitive ion channel protein 1, mitochondrial-like [Prosopis alba]XP_028770399.1 mechanosensitive ion channel protein 1, mitochondrial-like [Prosopis alba]